MGKKYDAYSKALDAQDAARDRLAATNGGSTKDAATAARTNAEQADRIVADAWNELMKDPEG
jgi:hypothetical protein